jgi:hypothetical protein
MENFNKLKKAHQAFIKNYVRTCFNGAQAYADTYGTDNATGRANAPGLLKRDDVKRGLNEYLDAYFSNLDNDFERNILKMYQTLAFYCPSDIINSEGELIKSPKELGDLAYCITGFDFVVDKDGQEHTRPKLADRTKALKELANATERLRSKLTVDLNVVYLPESDAEL